MFSVTVNPGTLLKNEIIREIHLVQDLQKEEGISAEKRIHEIRKSIMRMRSLLRLLKSVFRIKTYFRLDSLLGSAGNSLSDLRDYTVHYHTFLDLISDHPSILPDELSHHIALQLSEKAEIRGRDRMAFQKLGLYLQEAFQLLNMESLSNISQVDLLNALDKSYIKARNSYQDAIYTLDTEIIHKWRRHSRYFLLQLKNSHTFSDQDFLLLRNELGGLTHKLGDEHDLYSLEEVLYKNFKLSDEEHQIIHLMISKSRSRILKSAFRIAESLFTAERIQSYRSLVFA